MHIQYLQSLFCRDAEAALSETTFDSNVFSSEDIVMDEVQCSGDERYLQDCTHDRIHDCFTHELAGVRCHPLENEGEPDCFNSLNSL